jgi:hypothetical protein
MKFAKIYKYSKGPCPLLSEFIESQRYDTSFGILPLLIEVAKNGVIAIRVFHKHGVLHFVSYLAFKPC